MLRTLSWFFFAIGVVEAVCIVAGKLDPFIGFAAICFAIYFGGVLHGLFEIRRELNALRNRLEPAELRPDGKHGSVEKLRH